MGALFASALDPFGREAYEQALGIPSGSMLDALPYADWSEAQQLNALAAQTTPSGADAVQETGLTARERKIESYTNLLARAQSAEQISQLIMWDDNFFAQAVGDVRRNGFDSEFAALSGFEMGREDDPNRLADALASQREQFAAAILDRADFAGAIATRGLNGIGVDGFEGMSHPEVAKLSSDTIDFFGDPASFEDVTREQFQAMYASGLMDYKTHDVVGFPAEQRRLDKASLIASVVTLGTGIALNPRAAINTVKGIGRAGLSALQLSGKQLGRLKDVFAGKFAAIESRAPDSAFNLSRASLEVPAGLNPLDPRKLELWQSYLGKRGVNFEIGTNRANQVLQHENAFGVFEKSLVDIDTNTFNRTIYLRERFNRSEFYEEAFHALDDLKGLPTKDIVNGRTILVNELRAKESLLNVQQSRLNNNRAPILEYEEFLKLEYDLDLVRQGRY
jgi:hypothetical protein